MDFAYSAQEEAFRKEVRDWLDIHVKELPAWWRNPDVMGPEIDSKEYHEFGLWWHKKLYDAGFVGIAWPKEYGGRGATVLEQTVYNEEMAKARVPGPSNGLGIGWAGPTIMAYGTEEQKKRFLPKILSAEEWWCQGFSEPGAGSDLASLQTRRRRHGRPLHRQRPEGLDDRRPLRRLGYPAGPDRPERTQAPRAHLPAAGHALARA